MEQSEKSARAPKISIITVCYNEEGSIEATCKSVVSQGFGNFEWIVVDGGSSDRTLDILKKYSANISVLISEKDRGVYDAMNKGIRHAKGEYLLFLNGGDHLFGSDVLEKVFFENAYDADILYGNCCLLLRDGSKEILNYKEKINKYYFLDTCINHQSTFIKRDLFEKHGYYDEDFKILADYEKWNCFMNGGVAFKKLPFVVSNFMGFDGLSSQEKTRALNAKERSLIISRYFRWHELFLHRILGCSKKVILGFVSMAHAFKKFIKNISLSNKLRRPLRRAFRLIKPKK